MDRDGLPLPEQVSKLKRRLVQLESTVNGLPSKAREISVDMSGDKIFGLIAVAVLVAGALGGAATCSHYNIEEQRLSDNYRLAEAEQRRVSEASDADRLVAAQARAEQAAEAEAARGSETCARACASMSAEVIRPHPCMCGRNGVLTLFAQDYSTFSRLREVERLSAPEPIEAETETPDE